MISSNCNKDKRQIEQCLQDILWTFRVKIASDLLPVTENCQTCALVVIIRLVNSHCGKSVATHCKQDSLLINIKGHLTLQGTKYHPPVLPSLCFLLHSTHEQHRGVLVWSTPDSASLFFFLSFFFFFKRGLHSNTVPVTSGPDFCPSCSRNKDKKLWREGDRGEESQGTGQLFRGMNDMEAWGRL